MHKRHSEPNASPYLNLIGLDAAVDARIELNFGYEAEIFFGTYLTDNTSER